MDFDFAIIGLGLIGGSLARAIKRNDTNSTVIAYDPNGINLDYAKLAGVIDGKVSDDNIGSCKYIFLTAPLNASIEWLENNAHLLQRDQIVIDCCGTKRRICEAGFRLMEQCEFTFVGGHPMAGSNIDGFRNSRANLFDGAVFVTVFRNRNDIFLMSEINDLVKSLGFSGISSMTAEEHDEIIAFTSQLSHIVPSAFVKSGKAVSRGTAITGGSFRDMTRVAYLNDNMWTDLCMENCDNLIGDLDTLIRELGNYRSALVNRDRAKLQTLFAEGSLQKKRIEDLRNS